MTRGMFYTVFTIGFAAAIAAISLATGVTLFLWHRPFWFVAVELEQLGLQAPWLTPLYLALLISSFGLFVAYWTFQAQQMAAGWIADRAIAKLNVEYAGLLQRFGSAQADEVIKLRLLETAAQSKAPFGIFDLSTLNGRI